MRHLGIPEPAKNIVKLSRIKMDRKWLASDFGWRATVKNHKAVGALE